MEGKWATVSARTGSNLHKSIICSFILWWFPSGGLANQGIACPNWVSAICAGLGVGVGVGVGEGVVVGVDVGVGVAVGVGVGVAVGVGTGVSVGTSVAIGAAVGLAVGSLSAAVVAWGGTTGVTAAAKSETWLGTVGAGSVASATGESVGAG